MVARTPRRTHRHAAEALRLSSDILRHVAEGVFIVRISDGVLLFTNPRFEQMFGYSSGELVGKHVSVLNAPTDKSLEETAREIAEVLQTDGRWEGEVYSRRKDDTQFWCHASISTIAHAEFGTVWIGVTRDITERKRLQEDLLRANVFLDSIVENIPNIVFVKDAKSLEYVLFNRAGAEVFRQRRADLLGKNDFELFPKAQADFFTETDRAVLRNKTLLDIPEEPINSANDGGRILHTKKIPILDDQGEPTYLLGISEDITEQRRVHEQLRESEERFRGTFEQAAVGIAHVAPDGRWLRVNHRLCHILGYTERELRAQTFQDITHPDDLDKDLGHVRDILDGKIQTYSMEKRYVRQDGSLVWADLTVSLVREPSGQPKYFISVVQDIEARKRAESALRESEERFSNAFEHAPIAMALVALDGQPLRVNSAMCHMFGYEREELLAMRPWDVTPPEEMLTRLEQLRQMVMGERDSWQLENRYRHKLGHEVWGLSHTSIVRSEDGTPLYVISQVQNITERRHAEQVRRRHERATTIVNGILRAINGHLDVKAAFPEVCTGLRELAGCAAVSLNLFDERREWLSFVAADAPWAVGVSPGTRLRAAEIPAVANVLAGRPHVVGDLATELQYPIVQLIYALGFRSVVSLPLCAGSDIVGFLNLFWREVDGCQSGEMGALTQVTNAVAIAVEKSRLFEQVSIGQERLAMLSQRLLEVQEIERQHLARELHDEVGQMLTALKLSLDTIDRMPPPAGQTRLQEARHHLEELLARVRDLSLDLRPAMLDDLGLLAALVWLVDRYSHQTNIQIHIEHDGVNRRFAPQIETGAYRIVQEALTNVARHAGVRQATVRLWVDDSTLAVQIIDTGKGFEPALASADGARGGVLGMRERARLLGGDLTIESTPGAGTRVTAHLPV